jgi:hypothetical protein
MISKIISTTLRALVPAQEGDNLQQRDAEIDAFVPLFCKLLHTKFCSVPVAGLSCLTPTQALSQLSVRGQAFTGLYQFLESTKAVQHEFIQEAEYRASCADELTRAPFSWSFGVATTTIILSVSTSLVSAGYVADFLENQLASDYGDIMKEKPTSIVIGLSWLASVSVTMWYLCQMAISITKSNDKDLSVLTKLSEHALPTISRVTYTMAATWYNWPLLLDGDIAQLEEKCSTTFCEWRIRILRNDMSQHVKRGRVNFS